jgi:hypothetical protein
VTFARENEDLGDETPPLQLYPPQIPHGMKNVIFPGFHDERPANNCLKYGKAF